MPTDFIPFHVDAFGEFRAEDVAFRFRDEPRPTTSEIERSIEHAWQRMSAECAERGAVLFNGPLVAYRGHCVTDGTLRIEAGPTCYRDFVGTNLSRGEDVEKLGWLHFANPIGATALITSADGWLLLGRRSRLVADAPGHLHTFGGALELGDVRPDGGLDAFGAVKRELAEELLVEEDQIRDMFCIGMVHDARIWQPELLFEVRVRLTRGDVVGRIADRGVRLEHSAIEGVRDEAGEIEPFIRTASPMTPVCIAALCLHGRMRWGESWYEDLRDRLLPGA